jgi:ankyrin repeat protein
VGWDRPCHLRIQEGFEPSQYDMKNWSRRRCAPEGSLAALGLETYDPRTQLIARHPRTDSLAERRAQLPPPVADAGLAFRTNVCWALFHGRFDELKPELYNEVGGLSSQWIRDLQGENPLFHYAFVSWVGLSSERFGEKQIGPSTEMWWNTMREGVEVDTNNHRVHIAVGLSEHYAASYKLAESTANADGLIGNGGADLLQNFLKMREGMAAAAFGDTKNVGKMLDRRADGSYTMNAAEWEAGLLADVGQLLETWPRQSVALWQFHENINRHLEGRPSLQELFARTRQEPNWNALHVAALSDDVSGIYRALTGGIDVQSVDRGGMSALALAAAHGRSLSIGALLAAGIKVDTTTSGGTTALHLAAAAGQSNCLRLLLDAGADVAKRNAGGESALHFAAGSGSRASLSMLASKGADIETSSMAGRRPLHTAASQNRSEVLQALLDLGADVHATDGVGATALHVAAAGNAKDAIGVLIARGADVNARSTAGHTPLHVAAITKSVEVIRPLLLRGADAKAEDKDGRTPLQLAILANDDELIEVLRANQD